MEVFGRYQIQEKLGQGGMGVVYRAFDSVLQRIVALKLVLSPEELDPEMRERFFREARAAGHLTHKNIVTIYDLGEHEGKPYLAMEYLEGEDLQRRLARPERMSLGHRLDLASEISQGVEYAHSHGVIHRDIKPANIYITEDGGAKILDFGLARLVTSQLTKSNMLMGTLNYMAPEQVRGERADQRSDVFSVGVVLYELLGGRKAFEGDSVASTLYKILQEAPVPLLRVDPAIPLELTHIVERAIAKLRDERYPDMSALRRDLDAYRDYYRASGPTTPLPKFITVSSTSGPQASTQPTVVVRDPSAQMRPASGAGAATLSGYLAGRSARNLVIAAGALLVAVGGWYVVRKAAEPAPVPSSSAPVQPSEDRIAARLRVAQQALDAKQFGAALTAAEALLVEAPQNAGARRVRQAAREGAVQDALARGSRHLASGETSEAIKAAGEALAFAPDNAEARRILDQAAARTSSPDADVAHRRMNEARAAADQAGARKQAASAFGTASRAGQDADRLYKAKRFADAAARYYEASGLYHRAEVAARSSRPVAVAPPSSPSSQTPAAPPPPTDTEPPSAPKPSVSVAPPPVLTPPAPAAAPISAPPPAAAPIPAPAPETPPAPAAEERITELLGRYKEALEARSIDQLKRIWPSLSGSAEGAIRQDFQHAARITVDLVDPQVSVSGATGRVTFTRRYSLITIEGQRPQSTSNVVVEVKRAGNTWVIDGIRFTPR
ncbi:MAG: serine/threonine-protein kinase [Vicinamibacterales bacterium]